MTLAEAIGAIGLLRGNPLAMERDRHMTVERRGRRVFLRRAAASLAAIELAGCAWPSTSPSARWTARQFHNQPVDSHLHSFLVDMWTEVAKQSDGRLVVTVYAQNNQIPGSDPGALAMLQGGELEFFALMGGILAKAVPATEIQGLPFAFATHAQVHQANDGELGAYLGRECAAKGIYRFQYGLMENGFRQIGMIDRAITTPDDLAAMRIRVPDGEMFRDLFSTLGAKPVTVNISGLYEALKVHSVDGQENPLVVTEFNKLYEVSRYQSMTNHMWSGFNLIANQRYWVQLPDDIQQIVLINVKKYVALQRASTDRLNHELETTLAQRGQHFNQADHKSFQGRLGDGFYARWKQQLGSAGWNALEQYVGRLGVSRSV
jgi:tripartite ATP-independent transporter DctP family solute receptor